MQDHALFKPLRSEPLPSAAAHFTYQVWFRDGALYLRYILLLKRLSKFLGVPLCMYISIRSVPDPSISDSVCHYLTLKSFIYDDAVH